MIKVGMFFVMGSVALCLESAIVIAFDVPAEAISMTLVCVSFLNYFFSKNIICFGLKKIG
jgi:hypothetical protein